MKAEEVLGPEVSYLNAIGALMYHTNCTKHGIYFVQDSVYLPQRDIGTESNTYSDTFKELFDWYANACYLSNLHKATSQTGYVFMKEDTTISWHSLKQTLVATS
ncbi:hypothetical protein OSB04_001193 [Centaurea solstitialis]|uniref:Uncharacterized protein n=1 Tax=Centaurea solstitialis TaxID=347529 RepID=A0AA38U8T5_9ASTR|nr:hypothetical protein OSB04_001193 [Centaurea solstitialis]